MMKKVKFGAELLLALVMVFIGVVLFVRIPNILKWLGIILALLGLMLGIYAGLHLGKCWDVKSGRRAVTSEEEESSTKKITSFRALRHAEDDVADRLVEAEDILSAAEDYEDAVASRRHELEEKLARARARRRT